MAVTGVTRPPEVAGIFYPSDPQSCRDLVNRCLDDARPSWTGTAKVVVAPHAGLEYSGPIAGTAFRPLEAMRGTIRRVVIIGPAHRFGFRGLRTTTADAWATPLGTVPVDWTAMQDLLSLPTVRVSDGPFGREHSLEVHLPFLQQVLEDFAIVPILVGNASHAEVEEALTTVWGGSETLISVSSDLSHFLDYESARSLDAETGRFIELLQPEKIDADHACGHRVLGGALLRARELDLRVTAFDLRNSGDTCGDRREVVGYGAFSMEYAGTARLSREHRARLLCAARKSLEFGLQYGRAPPVQSLSDVPAPLRAMRASFVTLRIDGRLRGCIGSVPARRPLVHDVVANAYRAGFEDERFRPVSEKEVPRIEIEVSVLSTPRPIRQVDEVSLARQLNPDIDGLILRSGDHRGVFLPGVWDRVSQPDRFVQFLKNKAGFGVEDWPESLRAYRFSVEQFGES